jgi:hypothetical protein
MTINEFSNEFDTLIQSYIQKVDFGNINPLAFDEYEKSVFLTKAQEDIVLDIYKGTTEFDSFESSEESRRLLSDLVETVELEPITDELIGIRDNSYFFSLPDNLMFITYETVLFKDTDVVNNTKKYIPVVPISQDDITKVLENPFKRNSKNRVLRLDSKDRMVELISNYDIEKYKIRYIKVPTPIILIDLPEDLSINNVTNKTECLLNESLHRKILDKAVLLAIASKNINR